MIKNQKVSILATSVSDKSVFDGFKMNDSFRWIVYDTLQSAWCEY